MRFSLNFIQEFLKVDVSPSELAQRLTMAGMEVEHLEQAGGDWIFDIEVTTNRYDWLSIAGIAKEIAAVLGKKIKIKYPSITKDSLLKEKNIIIEGPKDCPYYIGRAIRGVRIKKSESWLKQRIFNCGIKNSINNAVDITNYCMLKWGNPLHTFDQDKIEGNIYIRRAKKGESFIGIDAKARVLDKNNLVIADDQKVIALAGIMGAKNSEVDETTKNIFLEAAIFSPLTIRRSRRLIGLDTESSYRFERQVSPIHLEYASYEAAKLIEKFAQGSLGGFKTAGIKPTAGRRKIIISSQGLNAYLGTSFSPAQIKKILLSLDFEVYPVRSNSPRAGVAKQASNGVNKASEDKLTVIPAVSRFDLSREVDVYEEFARIQGYDKIPARIPFLTGYSKDNLVLENFNSYDIKNRASEYIALLGFKEIVTYSLDSSDELVKVSGKETIGVINPLRKQENALRTTLLLGMIKSIKHNLNRNQSCLRFFEIADIYIKGKKSFLEIPTAALGLSGSSGEFFYLKRAVEDILCYFNINNIEFKQESVKKFTPLEAQAKGAASAKSESSLMGFTSALKIIVSGKEIGFLGKLDDKFRKDCDLREDLFFAQIDLEALVKNKLKIKFTPFSPYPAVFRDLSLFLKKDMKFEEVEKTIKERNNYLADLRIVDIYKGKDVPLGVSAFTLRIFYQSKDKTLTSNEIDDFHNNIRERLSAQKGVTLR
ncbi:MAG: phenylalanine--tRNA ligase subunit beta [Candidatus Omnitrophota bacterium]